MQLKYFLICNKFNLGLIIGMFFISGCSSSGLRPTFFRDNYSQQKTRWDGAKVKELMWKPQAVSFVNGINSVDSVDPYRTFCRERKQIRNVELKFVAILPKAPIGMPLDKAIALDKNVLSLIRDWVKQIFLLIGYSGPPYGIGSPRGDYDEERAYGIRSGSIEEVIHDAKSSIQGDRISFIILRLQSGQWIVMKNEVLMASTSSEVLQSFRGVLSEVHDKLGSVPHPLLLVGEESYTGNHFFPLKAGYFSELDKIYSDYTLLLPNNSVTSAILQKDDIWREHIPLATSILEAKTDDPKVMNVQASLDLSEFCTYGRKVEDLKSK